MVSLGKLRDEVVGVGGTRRSLDLSVGGVGAGVGDVLGDARREQDGLLQHDGALPAQVLEPVLAQVDPVEQNSPGRHIVEADEQSRERRLPCAGHARDSDA